MLAVLLALAFGLSSTCPLLAQPADGNNKEAPSTTPSSEDAEKKDTNPADAVEKIPLSEEIPVTTTPAKDRDELPLLGWTAFWTLVIVAAIIACFYLVRKLLPRSRLFFASDAITILAQRNITPNASLFLVQMGRKVVRIGLARDTISFLGEVSDPDEIAYIRSLSPAARKESAEKIFESELKAALAKQEIRETMLTPDEDEKEQIDALRQEIAKIRNVIEGWR